MKYIDNRLIAAGPRAKGKGAIDWLNPKELTVLRREELETTDRGVILTQRRHDPPRRQNLPPPRRRPLPPLPI